VCLRVDEMEMEIFVEKKSIALKVLYDLWPCVDSINNGVMPIRVSHLLFGILLLGTLASPVTDAHLHLNQTCSLEEKTLELECTG
jgi:hypothetical protein